MPRRGGRGGRGGKGKPGDRRVAFSGKAKKEYLKDKRERKAAAADAAWAADEAERDAAMDGIDGEASSATTIDPEARLTSSLGKSGLHNALSTIVVRELDSEVERRRGLATIPVRIDDRGLTTVAPTPDRDYGDVSIPRSVVATTAMDAVAAAGADVGDAETGFFRMWLRRVYGRYRPEQLSTFEHNPLVWKQLWGTVAGATLVAVVADVRNPLFHLPNSLYAYITEHSHKPLVVMLTKTDLVPPETVSAWEEAVRERFPLVSHVLPFTAAASPAWEETRLSARRRAIRASLKAYDYAHKAKRAEGVDALLEAGNASDSQRAIVRAGVMLASGSGRGGIDEALRLAGITRTGEAVPEEATDDVSAAATDEGRGEDDDDGAKTATKPGKKRGKAGKKRGKGRRRGGCESDDEYASKLAVRQAAVDELEAVQRRDKSMGGRTADGALAASASGMELKASLIDADWTSQPRVVIGVIGQPNVGKSSLINALTGAKRVSVSRTAGHTKRLQHIPVCPGLTVLDCPGLLFPRSYGPSHTSGHGTDLDEAALDHVLAERSHQDSDSDSEEIADDTPASAPASSASAYATAAWRADVDRNRAMQECLGVVPLAQVREPYTAVRFLAERLPLETLYGLKPVDLDTSGGAGDSHAWSAWDICESFAIKRGIFYARTGRPDAHAAGRAILQDAVDGILPIYFAPIADGSESGTAASE